jgi:hypothetical protein
MFHPDGRDAEADWLTWNAPQILVLKNSPPKENEEGLRRTLFSESSVFSTALHGYHQQLLRTL